MTDYLEKIGFCRECGDRVEFVDYQQYPNQIGTDARPIRIFPVTRPCGHSAGFVAEKPVRAEREIWRSTYPPGRPRCMFRREDESGYMFGCLKPDGHEGAHSCDE